MDGAGVGPTTGDFGTAPAGLAGLEGTAEAAAPNGFNPGDAGGVARAGAIAGDFFVRPAAAAANETPLVTV
jgi:hypothetical protein